MQPLNLLAGEALNPLIPHTAEVIVGFIAFTLLFLVLKSKVVPMFEKAYAARTEAIQGGIERAEKAQLEAQRALVQYNERVLSAHSFSTTNNSHLHRVKQPNFVKMHVHKALQFLKNSALRRKMKQHASPLQLTLPSKLSVNRQ